MGFDRDLMRFMGFNGDFMVFIMWFYGISMEVYQRNMGIFMEYTILHTRWHTRWDVFQGWTIGYNRKNGSLSHVLSHKIGGIIWYIMV
jgi:hypothetical protein